MYNDRIVEINEAITAAERALTHLRSARGYLGSASNWGLLDIFGGGFLTTMVKHSKLDDAQRELERARDSVRDLGRELRDVEFATDIDISIDDFLKFADFFFDGFVADWMVQSKIARARDQVDEAIERVEAIRRQLYAMR